MSFPVVTENIRLSPVLKLSAQFVPSQASDASSQAGGLNALTATYPFVVLDLP